ncbi:zinc-binding protein A33 isoform X2 [Ictalurus punctatus]|uniref:Zinc-binding protein A33 isoform X2 n=1 Tax=Ictalurus punctatus TaxID=7998 RepID=A0A2D0PT78_ICTPU|nr:zinc-binding protein A33 isoform X2 [Ictalurus punctatus]
MASKRSFSEEDFACPVCCDVFKEPVLLSCGHSACSTCVHRYWDTKGCRECPLCRKRSATNPPINLALKNLSQTFLEFRGDPETLCDIHGEKLKLFCVNDGQAACLMCRDSSKHLQHHFIPVDEAASELKDILKSAVNTLKMKIRSFHDAQVHFHRNVHHIQNFETNLEKVQYKDSEPNISSEEVINVAKYLGNLQFQVWNKMQSFIKYSPVVLDPNTAHSQLILSLDLTSVRDSDDDHEDQSDMPRLPVLDTPERFRSLCVLGSEGFSSGLHCWDVEVGSSTFWMLGVTTESVQRKEFNVFPSGAWGIGYDDQKLCARSPSEAYTPLPLTTKPQMVRIRLDMDSGEVWFLDPASNAVIHMFSHHFTEKVFPFFHSMCSLFPLKIMPLQPFVVLRKLP